MYNVMCIVTEFHTIPTVHYNNIVTQDIIETCTSSTATNVHRCTNQRGGTNCIMPFARTPDDVDNIGTLFDSKDVSRCGTCRDERGLHQIPNSTRRLRKQSSVMVAISNGTILRESLVVNMNGIKSGC